MVVKHNVFPMCLIAGSESGSMPYAQLHYPLKNKELFENGFPAQFIAEGLDQTPWLVLYVVDFVGRLFLIVPIPKCDCEWDGVGRRRL